jgi:hypothetical protein
VNRIGTAPSDQCTVGAVRPSQTFSRTDFRCAWSGRRPRTTVTNKTLYVRIEVRAREAPGNGNRSDTVAFGLLVRLDAVLVRIRGLHWTERRAASLQRIRSDHAP